MAFDYSDSLICIHDFDEPIEKVQTGSDRKKDRDNKEEGKKECESNGDSNKSVAWHRSGSGMNDN